MTPLRTPLYGEHVRLGARMAPFGGWDMPIQYEGILAEHTETRNNCAVFDICHMGEFQLSGTTAERDLERLLTQSIASLATGQCRYGYLLRDDGGVLDDLTCYKLDNEKYLLVVNAGTCANDAQWIRRHLSPQTVFEDQSPITAKLDIQGPNSFEVMKTALDGNLPELKFFYGTHVKLNGITCWLSRTGYTGEWGYELYFPHTEAVNFWRLFTETLGVRPAGLGARDTLRLEAGYPLYGHELSDAQTPIPCSRGMFIDMNKDFIGKDAVRRDIEQGTPRVLAGLKLAGRGAARSHDPVMAGGHEIGMVTSGSFAPSVGTAIALAYVDCKYAEPGQEVGITVRNRELEAEVVKLPFYEGSARRKRS
ncbi:MAG: glycine cleavage system aminomethyltransferase GcvT [Kiritimatiellia bacterium]